MSSNIVMSASNAKTQPSFKSILNSEFFKLLHNRTVTIFAAIIFGIFAINIFFSIAFFTNVSAIASDLTGLNLVVSQALQTNMNWIGIMMIFITVMAIGQDYQNGTIRVILARGSGRMRVLAAKYTAALLYVFFVLVIQYILTSIIMIYPISLSGQNFFGSQPSHFFQEIALFFLVTIVSVIATGLMAAAITTIGRSLTFGFAISLLWFPVESILKVMVLLFGVASFKNPETAYNLTNNFLGSALSNLGSAVISHFGQISVPTTLNGYSFAPPSALTDGIIIAVYSAIFFVGMFAYVRSRDVHN